MPSRPAVPIPGGLDKFALELVDFMSELAQEGDRAIVIGGAARVEVALERLLKSVLHHNPMGSDELFDVDRPLGTFSAKIKLGDRLGLFDVEMVKALNMIRRIRNEFAHTTTHARLSQPEHTDRVNELAKCADFYDVMPTVRAWSDPLFGDPLKASFCMSLWLVTSVLELAARKNNPMQAAWYALLSDKKTWGGGKT